MVKERIDAIEEAYHKAGFRTIHREGGAISFAKKAPVVVIDRGNRVHAGSTTKGPKPAGKRRS